MATSADFVSKDLYLIWQAISSGGIVGAVTVVNAAYVAGQVDLTSGDLIGKDLLKMSIILDGVEQRTIGNILSFDDATGKIRLNASLPYNSNWLIMAVN